MCGREEFASSLDTDDNCWAPYECMLDVEVFL